MKKILFTTLALSLISASAFASKARIIALGEESSDNFFIQDQRSIFINSAQIHNHKDSVFMEWGGNGSAISNASLDSDTKPKQQGGFLMSSGKYIYGVHLGKESNVASFLRILSSDTTSSSEYLQTSDNVTDFFFGGGDKVKWAANLLYSKSENKKDGKVLTDNKSIAVRLGVLWEKYEFYINSSILGESDGKGLTGEPKFDGNLGLQVGASYTCNEHGKFYGSFKKLDWKQSFGVGNARRNSDGGFTRLDLGWGYDLYNSDRTRIFSRLSLRKIDVEIKLATQAELKHTLVPLTIGFETDANSWLQWRGSIGHNLYGKVKEKGLAQFSGALQTGALNTYNASKTDGEKTIVNSTSVNAGASLLFGDLTVDGVIGTSVQGSLSLNTLFTRTAVTYKF